MDYIIDKVMDYISENSQYDDDERAIIRYGLELLILKIIFTVGAVIIGALMGCFMECCIFLTAFMCLRSLAGGYHAGTRAVCAMESSALLIGCLVGIKLACISHTVAAVVYVLSAAAALWVWKIGPVDCENKRLDESEKERIRTKMRVCIVIEGIIEFAAAAIGAAAVSTCIGLAVIAAWILAFVGQLEKT